jgi:hypothetical protein
MMTKVLVEMSEEVRTWLLKQVTGTELMWSHEEGYPSNLRLSRESLAALRAAKPAGEWEPLANDEVIGIQDAMDIVVGEVRELLYKACGITLDADVELCRRRTEGA